MSEEYKAFQNRQTEEIWNKHNPDAVDQYYADDFVLHDPPPGVAGDREGLKLLISGYLSAFPDLKVTNAQQLADGDHLVSRWTATGTHTGELMGIPATGKRINTHGISIVRIENGKIAEVWNESNQMDMMQQLGVVPGPGEG
jgi:steroid delta-isomerase-like uncharacterized protein